MSARIGIVSVKDVATGEAAKTLLQLIAAANHAIEVVEVGCCFHGKVNTDEPILVELVRQTDAGTMSAATPVKGDDNQGDTLDTTAQHTATAEPTTTDVVRAWTVHPQTGLIYQAPDKAPIIVKAAGRLGLRVTAADLTGDTVDADAYLVFVE